MVIEHGRYQIRPYGNRLCWEVFEWRENMYSRKHKTTRTGWASLGIYPSTLGAALARVYELELKDGDDARDVHAAMTTARRLHDELMNAAVDGQDGRRGLV